MEFDDSTPLLSVYVSTVAAHLGEAVFRQGRLDEAERRQHRERGDRCERRPVQRDVVERLRAKVLAARGEFMGARALARQAVDSAAGVGFLDDVALTRLDLSRILHAAGDPETRAAATQALGRFERKGNLVGVGWAREALGESGP